MFGSMLGLQLHHAVSVHAVKFHMFHKRLVTLQGNT